MRTQSPTWILAGLLAVSCLPAAIDPSGDVMLVWPAGHEARHVALLREAGVTAVLLPWPGAPSTAQFAQNCRATGITPVADLSAAKGVEEARGALAGARGAGFTAVALEGATFPDEKALAAFLAGWTGLDALVFLKPEQIHWRVAPAQAVVREGQWPGVRSTPSQQGGAGAEVSSASREPWLDANSYWVAYLRALYPGRAALLGYRPDEAAGVKPDRLLPDHSLELSLIEAFAAGGNVVLHPPERYHVALLAGREETLAAWRRLGQTAAFLKQHAEWFRSPDGATVAVAAGTPEQSGEILNMLYRRNACPVVFSTAAPPALEPGRYRAVAVANVAAPPEAGRQRILAYARAGGLVMTAPAEENSPAWWSAPEARKTRSDLDRDWFALGKGTLIAYREPVLDPAEFALDVIDAVGVRVRDLRVLGADTVVGLLHRLAGGGLAVTLINCGARARDEFVVRVEGRYGKAAFHEPGVAAPRALKAARRTSGTEVTIERLARLAVVVLE